MSEQWTPEEDAAFRAETDSGSSENGHRESLTPATTWWPVDLAPIIAGLQAGEIVGPVPKLMARSDGPCLVYPGEVHSLAGEPETGKGWIALAEAATVIANGGHVLYLDCEDAPASIVGRLLALNAAPDAILERFTYVRPSDPFTAATLDALLTGHTYALAVIDGLSEAYTLLGLDPYSNVDAAKFLAALARPIAETGAAVLLIDHVVKAKDTRGRYALGAQHKLAGIAVAYSTSTIHTPSRTRAGLIKLTVEKDRHGHVRSHAQDGVIALAHITPDNDGHDVTVTVEPPEVRIDEKGEKRLTNIMEKVSRRAENTPGITTTAIQKGIKSRDEHVNSAIQTLLAEGYIERQESGTGRPTHHYSLKPYREATDPFPPLPNPFPDAVSGDPFPPSPPLRDGVRGTRSTGQAKNTEPLPGT